MGLSSFNRARRSRLEVERFETERFKKDNEARWDAHHARDRTRTGDDRDHEKSRKLEAKAGAEIGAKARDGIENEEHPDLPLRQDHAAEIAGRTMVDGQSGEPLDPVARLEQRIPSGTANEAIVGKTDVNSEGPTADEMEAVRLEGLTEEQKADDATKTKPEPGVAASAPEEVKNEEAPVPHPLDHDADGKKGGSLPKTVKTEDKKEELPAAGKSAGAGKEPPTSSATTAKK